ncbi:MAG TPA: ferritin family protein [Verrucomicrobiae bacterium]|nr:ferritin family protein [Verrucomicrobiae bacterium]
MTDRKEVLDALMKGMELEKETFDLYTRLEEKTFNRDGKRIFHWLARTEEQHYLKLSQLYSSLDTSGRWVFHGGTTFDLEPSQGESGFAADDIQALETAMEIEKKGIAWYEELIAKTSDEEGKKMLGVLRDEEVEHLRVVVEKHAEVTGKR